MGRPLAILGAAFGGLGTLLFGIAFYDRYWRHRDCFNTLGRCWNSLEEQVYVEGAGFVWGVPMALCAIALALCLRSALK
jgi:hypothetical protein